MDTKQNLANLIDAYAAAHKSGNNTLIEMAVASLQNFLNSVEITALPQTPLSESEED